MKEKDDFARQVWVFFSSVKLTVYLLMLLAVTSVIGTVVLQNGTPEQYVRLYGKGGYNLIRVLNVDDMYQAWWFLTLLVLLCVNIVVCSVERLSLTWKIIFPKKISFNANRFLTSKSARTLVLDLPADKTVAGCEAFMARHAGKVIRNDSDDGVLLYSEKGRWTRLGVYVVHASVLFMLLGAMIGAVFGFKASLRLDEGGLSDTVFAAKGGAPIQLDFSIRCNDFEVKFYDTGAPELFRSNLSLMENGKEILTRDIEVNHPLRYKGINIFQSSYGTASPDSAVFSILDTRTGKEVERTIKVGETIDLPDGAGTFRFQGFLPHFDFRGHNLGEAFFGKVALKNLKESQIGLPIKFPTFDKMRKGRFVFVVKKFEQRYYTGLQVTKDPGVVYVYTGFILMIIGCWITFFMSHQSFFMSVRSTADGRTEIFLAGKTNRNSQGMKLKLKKMATQLKEV